MSKSLSTYSAWVIALLAGGAAWYLIRRSKQSNPPSLINNENTNSSMKNYFGNSEFINSAKAKQLGLDNTPDDATWAKLFALRDNILNPARATLGYPIYINSGYRSPYLNSLVGGASNSQHVTGEAVDITTKDRSLNRTLFEILVRLGNFDQLIWEKGGEWIHVSFRANGGRGQMLSYNGSSYTNINNNWQTAIA